MHLPANTEFGCQNLPESALIKDEGYSAKSTYYLVLNSRLHEGHDAGYRRARRNVQLVAGGAPDARERVCIVARIQRSKQSRYRRAYHAG